MKVTIVEQYGDWNSVQRAALRTRNLKPVRPPTYKWKIGMLQSEHSPIRVMAFSILIEDIKSFIQTHLVRHKIGIEHFVASLRNDLSGIEGSKITRDTLNSMEIYINLQALITVSRKRLCRAAHSDTVEVWKAVLKSLKDKGHYEIVSCCVPECIYRGFCPENKRSCEYNTTRAYTEALFTYHNLSKGEPLRQ